MNLTEFLLARIAEDEHRARLAADEGAAVDVARLPKITFTHVVEWGPARVLAECEAKRAIVEVHHPHDHGGNHGRAQFCDECQWDHSDDSPRIDNQPVEGFGDHPCRTLAVLAQPFADHPDFDRAWRLS